MTQKIYNKIYYAIEKFLRKYFTCKVLGHDWIVGKWKEGNVYHWDSMTWLCEVCKDIQVRPVSSFKR